MIVLAREVFVCKCSTHVPSEDPNAGEVARRIRWVKGSEEHIGRLDREHHGPDHAVDFRARLSRGERWVMGLLDGAIVTYTWLHARPTVTYPYLPGCTFDLSPGVGYGYDAWTTPALRGEGLRRTGFLEELRILREELGCAWEASFFVKHQLDGATRSLGGVGIDIVPLWRVRLEKDRSLALERLVADDESALPHAV